MSNFKEFTFTVEGQNTKVKINMDCIASIVEKVDRCDIFEKVNKYVIYLTNGQRFEVNEKPEV